MSTSKPVVLCILDGWGLSETREANAPVLADTPHFDRLMATCPHATLITHGPDVGLPIGQMGNSEVGHTNIGAGRVVAMDLGRIDLAIEDGSFAANDGLRRFIARLEETGGTAHLMGVVSDGGVHGHLRHVVTAAEIIAAAGVPVVLHAVTDGRDVLPRSAPDFFSGLEDSLPAGVRIGTVTGRYFAMDRDNRWDRVSKAHAAMIHGHGLHAGNADDAISAAYERGESDEFIAATVIGDYSGARDGDGFFCLNFRADRAREILRAIADPEFDCFDTGLSPDWAALLGMVEYSETHNAWFYTVFPSREIANTLAAWVAGQGRTQFHIAETEKYPHVTFFFNGGEEEPEDGEVRYMAASPKVPTYDQKPEMSAGR